MKRIRLFLSKLPQTIRSTWRQSRWTDGKYWVTLTYSTNSESSQRKFEEHMLKEAETLLKKWRRATGGTLRAMRDGKKYDIR